MKYFDSRLNKRQKLVDTYRRLQEPSRRRKRKRIPAFNHYDVMKDIENQINRLFPRFYLKWYRGRYKKRKAYGEHPTLGGLV
jgi:hypothetical protein